MDEEKEEPSGKQNLIEEVTYNEKSIQWLQEVGKLATTLITAQKQASSKGAAAAIVYLINKKPT